MLAPNFTQVPNRFIDEHMASMSGAAAKIMVAICRKTIGWHKQTDRISFSQLRELTGISSNTTIRKGLDELIETGLINAIQVPGKTVQYDLNIPTIPNNGTVAIPETVTGCTKKWHSTIPETVNTKERKETNKRKTAYAEFVHMTEEEYGTLCDKYGEAKAKSMIAVLDNYKGSKGKRYKSDYRAILSWVVGKCAAVTLPAYKVRVPEKEAIEFHEDLGAGLAELKKRIR